MKRVKQFKGFSQFVAVLLIGFGMGYAAKDLVPPPKEAFPPPSQPLPLLGDDAVAVCFTPNKQCQTQLIREIDKAVQSIYVQGYSFTDPDIAYALARAAKRGANVKVLLDRSNRKDGRSAKDIIIQNGLPLRFDSPAGIAHNKIIIIDERTVITGSYNFSTAAYKRNTENLLVLHNPPLAQKYLQNWRARWEISNSSTSPPTLGSSDASP